MKGCNNDALARDGNDDALARDRRMSFLLAIEGGDGAGKGTAAAEVVRQLNADGCSATLLSFPRYADTAGGWALGEYLAGRLPRTVEPRAAAMLYALDRLESSDALRAAAAAHDVVVLDRYIASNLAYQAAKAPAAEAAALMAWIWALETQTFGLPAPDLNVFLATPVDMARRQIAMKQRRSYTDQAFDLNEANLTLQARVRDNYAALAATAWTGRWTTVHTATNGAMRTPADIAAEIVRAVPLPQGERDRRASASQGEGAK
ncbi:thymidylate kinase [uncultured Sphingomonas sp.]|uniref:thymidylate kinase n=1 Tax=uncultured Sphingomonas sp. TaxID=158754 RepID=UPI0035CC8D36